jgi:acyl-CoA thioesterase-1
VLLANPGAAKARDLLIFGDSLSAAYGIDVNAGWPQRLNERLRAAGYRLTVVNASISGETTAGGARRIGKLVNQYSPLCVLVALGANDGLRGLDPEETYRNLATILESIEQADACVILVKIRIPPNYGPQYTAAFEAVFDRLGHRENVIYAPFFLERIALDPAAFQADGLHPTAAAQARILDTLWPSIVSAMDGAMASSRSALHEDALP